MSTAPGSSDARAAESRAAEVSTMADGSRTVGQDTDSTAAAAAAAASPSSVSPASQLPYPSNAMPALYVVDRPAEHATDGKDLEDPQSQQQPGSQAHDSSSSTKSSGRTVEGDAGSYDTYKHDSTNVDAQAREHAPMGAAAVPAEQEANPTEGITGPSTRPKADRRATITTPAHPGLNKRTTTTLTAATSRGSVLTAADLDMDDDKDWPEDPQRLWRCLLNRNLPAPKPRTRMEDAPLIPLYTANFFSKITYTWIQPIITLGYQRFLVKEDLWRLPPDKESGPLGERVAEAWEKRLAKQQAWNAALEDGTYKPSAGKRTWWKIRNKLGWGSADGKMPVPGLEWVISDVFFWQWWTAGFIKVAGDVLTTTSPLVTKRIINFGTQRYLAYRGVPGYTAPPIGHGIGWAFLLFFMQITSSLCLHWFFVQSMGVGVLARGALIASLYKRALSLSGKARATITTGKLVNHISTDISRIDFACGFFHMSWTAPIQLIVVVIILLVQLGAVSLAGVGFLLVATPLQGIAMKKMFGLRMKAMGWTDKRAKLIQELLGGMRIIKFFAWENPYLNKIHDLRRRELQQIRKLLLIRALTMAVAMSLPVLATVIAFTAFAYTSGKATNPAVIFTSLTLFNLLRMPLMMLPVSLATATDAKNAFNRLREVFLADRITHTFETDPNADYAVEVTKGTFLWEGAPPEDPAANKKNKAGGPGAAVKGDKRSRSKSPDKKKSAATAAKPSVKQSKMPWKQKGNIAEQNQSANDAVEKEAITGDVTDAAYPVSGPGSDETDANALAEKKAAAQAARTDPQIKEIDLRIPRGQLCAIVGPVGSGKSSLLNGLIGEMKRISGTVKFGGSVGYCNQQAWIQNATLRDNILFGQPYDAKRYQKAIFDACLISDLEMLPNGDMTEIGEKGINLSGGQKQRVNIARALYYNADITLFDDPLSAVDAHVGKHLFEHAIKGALAGKTRVLVTHALHFLPEVDHIITIDNGKIVEQGTYSELLARNGAFAALVAEFGNKEEEESKKKDEKEEAAIDGKAGQKKAKAQLKKTDKLMQEEERMTGAVGGKVYGSYLRAANPVMGILLVMSLVLMQGATVVNSYTLVWWQENKFGQGRGFYLGLYAGLGVGVAVFTFIMGAFAALMGFNVSNALHRGGITRVMHAPMSMFDTTPLGRIMNRFSKDMDTIDNTLNDSMRMAISTFAQIIGSIVLIAIVQQYFLIAVAVVMLLYIDFARVYRYSAREIKRLDNLLRSSLYAHFSESLSGLSTIRAYGETEKFMRTNAHHTDVENRAYFLTIINQRWLGLRLDFFGTILTFVVAIIAVTTSETINPSQIGLVLSYILAVQMSFTWAVRQFAEVENDMNSVERLLHYSNELEQEAAFEVPDKKPPAQWPQAGAIEFNDVKLRYRPGLPLVLHGLSMSVKGGEKIGVVGRTGAGKSSLMQAIFRIVELDSGSIVIDGRDISEMGLRDLRSHVSIIPQDALLFAGTLRTNLDPFNQHDDARLWDALRRAYLADRSNDSQISSERTNRFNLDMVIDEEGLNLSVGERSLVSLARALVKDSKVVILDEATASVDLETDNKIQKTIREEFSDKTLLTIAHRLRTIISYDRILVMGDGRMLEFASPLELFDQVGGIFRGMCDQSSINREDIERSRFESTSNLPSGRASLDLEKAPAIPENPKQ